MTKEEWFKRLNGMSATVRMAAHCIGLDKKAPYKRWGKYWYRPYRNRYEIAPDSGFAHDWVLLEGRGYGTLMA